MKKQPESWFRNAIVSGIQQLLSLSLDGTPPSKTITLTASTWIEVLWPTRRWDAELDETRIAEAFRQLMIRCDRWPAPRQLLLVLPSRPERLKLTPPAKGRDAAMQAIKHAKEILGS
ncbi:hypothetical protein [Nitrosomonas sp.]|uniref:hypothetical protein n=1 Tax=Nitrosomonas sp. TaxID=42353 RepID=UPI001D1C0935|nr:hypothetical protein [Nitrosomonas sp.]MCB1950155.1 hypothetical protein [Nitrosomonas sp.]